MDVSRAKLIWQNLLDLHSTRLVQRSFLEKPIGLYMSAELEHIFLRWKSVELAWTIDDSRPTKEKEVFFDISINHFHILRGGRWIVLVSPYGYVSYADLDAEEIRRVPLISPPFDTGLGVALINEFFDAPAISFNIAISTLIIEIKPQGFMRSYC